MKFRQRNRTRRRNVLKRRVTRKKGGGDVFKRNGGPIKVDLVVARYKEKLDWVRDYSQRDFHKIHLYNKGPQNITCDTIAAQKNCKVYDMSDKNVGVCDHTYLYHIIENWDNLADVTLFCPGSIYLPYKREKFDRILNKIVETGDTVFIVSNNRTDMGRTVKEIFSNFVLDSHLVANTSNRNNIGMSVVAPAKDRPFGVWYDKHVGTDIYGYSLWGIFAASKEHIKKREKSFYENLIKQVSSNKHEEASHYMERAWGGIINAPSHFFNHDGTPYRDPLHKTGGSAPIKFGILGIFKNEEGAIREWIEHYQENGVDEIVLLNNNSTDNWKDKIRGLKNVHVVDAPRPHVQSENYYNLGMPIIRDKGINVMAILDLDEFMFATDEKPLKEHIEKIFGAADRPAQFSCRWKMFGSSGHDKQPASIRKSFTKVKKELDENIKSVVWVDDIVDYTGSKEGPWGYYKGINQHRCYVGDKKTIECPRGIQINHYAIQSKEFFGNNKMTRGAVDTIDNVRDWKYFEKYDHKEEDDTQLKSIVEKREKHT